MKTIKDFIKYLSKFGRKDCPEEYYQAWKILVLKTDEYRDNSTEFTHLYRQFEHYKQNWKKAVEA